MGRAIYRTLHQGLRQTARRLIDVATQDQRAPKTTMLFAQGLVPSERGHCGTCRCKRVDFVSTLGASGSSASRPSDPIAAGNGP